MEHSAVRRGIELRDQALAEFCLSENERLLAAEVKNLNRIHSLSLRLAEAQSLTDVLIDVLRTGAGLVNAKLGSAQLLPPTVNWGWWDRSASMTASSKNLRP